MLVYTGRRLFQIIPVLIGIPLLVFIVFFIIPGDPIQSFSGRRAVSPELQKEITEDFHLDQPIWKQYLLYVNDLLHGDLGISYKKRRPVSNILTEKFFNSAKLALVAIIIEILIGIIAGVVSAIKKYTFWDTLITISTSIAVAIPIYWLGMLLQISFGLRIELLPVSGMGDGSWRFYVLPALTLASVSTAYIARITRSQMLEIEGQDYIRTAYAKGLSTRQVIFKHMLRNALIPVITFIGLDLGALIGGAILTETVFNWPGVGFEIFLAITRRDRPVVLGGVLIITIIIVLINLIVDILYAVIDPRIRHQKARV